MITDMGGLGMTPPLRGGRKIIRMSERKKLLKIKKNYFIKIEKKLIVCGRVGIVNL